jgi:hypothetical protein|tara:strand:+ start:116 stop:220 length:105 start_codon:yes stop_codon:yes gene_type:complete
MAAVGVGLLPKPTFQVILKAQVLIERYQCLSAIS